MKNILIVYSKMVTGGSTTSLLSLLNGIDYTRYSIDLQLYDNSGELQDQINKNVNVLPEIRKRVDYKKKYFKINYWIDLFKARALSKKYNNRLINSQFMSKYEAESCPKIEKYYETAISFLEFWPMEYLVRKVDALKKIGWIHIDIKEAGLLVGVNNSSFEKLDNIILVSNSCVENMKKIYPQFSKKILCIENILVKDTIINLANHPTNIKYKKEDLNFVSVCRLVCASKGLDRGIEAFKRLKNEKKLSKNICWYIIGEGPDYFKLKSMIEEYKLKDNIKLLGLHKNPYAIEKNMKFFLLPSRYEGKPMAVTEAQMLGIIPIVCNYSSATEQIKNGIDGIICDNTDEAIYNVLNEILQGRINSDYMKENLLKNNYSNLEEIEKIYSIL